MRQTSAYYIVPEYKRDPKRSTAAGISTRVRYAVRHVVFPTWHKTGIIKEIDSDLSLLQAQRKVKSWKAWQRRKDRERK